MRIVRDALVLVLACFGGTNLLIGLAGGPVRNDVWVQGPAGAVVLVSLAVAGLALGLALRRERLVRAASGALALAATVDAIAYLRLLHGGGLAGGAPLPLSFLVVLVLGSRALGRPPHRPSGRLVNVLAVGAAGTALLLLHLMSFGATDYRRPADAAVVFGAKVSPDGSPSGVLYDRTRTACRLYHEGLVNRIVLSGGQGDDAPISEPVCMARVAREAGVPAEALILDETGLNSAASLAAVAVLAGEHRWSRVLLVSNDYHLARLHLLSRPLAVRTYTVPAVETVDWPEKPLCVIRELAAWGWHFLRTARG